MIAAYREFYTGWLTHWGEKLAQTDAKSTAEALDDILRLNASVVLYVSSSVCFNFVFLNDNLRYLFTFILLTSYCVNQKLTHIGRFTASVHGHVTIALCGELLCVCIPLSCFFVLWLQMVHGGTNFGFYSGANTGAGASDYQPDITSYDYVSTCELFVGITMV